MNKQEMFNKVWEALHKQGKPAYDNGQCLYRAPGGLKCAAGHLISDEEFGKMRMYGCDTKVNINGMGIGHMSRESLPSHISENLVFVGELQNAHDFAEFDTNRGAHGVWLESWRGRMVELASKYNLTVPEIPRDLP